MLTQKKTRIWSKVFLAITCTFASLGLTRPISTAEGAVYTMTNVAAGNSVVVYSSSADGTISAPAFIPIGGAGTGAGLGSQGAGTGAASVFHQTLEPQCEAARGECSDGQIVAANAACD
jgi:hypothetical protein